MRKVMLAVGIAALVGCGGVDKEKYNAKEAEAAKYKQAVQDETGKSAALEAKVTSLQQQNATLQGQVGDLEKKLGETTAAKSGMEERAPVRLSERLLFKENSSKLTPEAKRALDAVADAIGKSKDKTVLIWGYTDNSEAAGKDAKAKRWQLSSTRAVEVAKYLAGRGLDPSAVGVAGFGEARPAAPNDTLANKTLNRRVEILLAPANIGVGMKTIEVKPAELGPKQ